MSTSPADSASNTAPPGVTWAGQVALVTGASGGIGGAIALDLCAAGATCHAVGRDEQRLESLLGRAQGLAGRIVPHRLELTADDQVESLRADLDAAGRLDVLVHSAGAIAYGRLDEATVDELDTLYRANVRAPFLLTQSCLPLLVRAGGQIVFINSSTGLTARAEAGLFSATQHALKALADALRDEVNGLGVRVLSVYPGRTATARMQQRFALEGRDYRPEVLLQPADIAQVVMSSLTLPRTAEVTNVSVRPFAKSY